MRASVGIAVLTVLGCLPSASGQAKDDRCASMKSDREVQECHLAVQKASDLSAALQSGSDRAAANDQEVTATGLRYDVHMSDCEDRWIALYRRPEDHEYTYGFVYIDPQAGFTFQYVGNFTIDGDRNFHEAPDSIPHEKLNLKIRLEQNGIAALLPPGALAQLGLHETPDWLKSYEDKADSVTHSVDWGFFYNAIGDSRRAVDYLGSAYRERPDAARLVAELAYAYNALGQPEDAIRVSKIEFARNPKDELVCREMAYAFLDIKSYKEATEQYPSCIALCDDSEKGRAEKSELAMNLAAAYARMGDTQSHDGWIKKARDWAPKGSAVYKHFHPDEQ